MSKVIKSVILGAASGCVLCALLLLLVSFILVKSGTLPINALGIIAVVIAGISSFLGAYLAIKVSKSNGLVIGATTGLIMFIITMFASAASGASDSVETVTRAVVMILSGCIGGIIAVNKAPNHRKV